MLHIDGYQLQVVVLELANQVVQRQGIPYNLILSGQMGLLYGFLHVVVGNGIVAPSVLNHEMVAETAFMDNDAMVGQIFNAVDFDGVNLLMQHAMREDLDDSLAVFAIFAMVLLSVASYPLAFLSL